MREEAVVVHIDLVTALGAGLRENWEGMLSARCPFRPVAWLDSGRTPVAEAPGLEGGSRAEALLKRLGEIAFALPEETPLFVATTVGAIDLLEQAELSESSGAPVCGLEELLKLARSRFKLEDAQLVCAACASGNLALARAAEEVAAGRSDFAVVLGCDMLSEFVLSGFLSLGAVSSAGARPYDRSRDGLTLGEAAAVAVLARREAAERLHLKRLGAIRNWGVSCDAVHITAPDLEGRQLAEAVRRAAGGEEIGAVIGHGTGTIYNDQAELAALHAVFGELPPLVSVKANCGHTLGAAGVVQLAAALEMLRSGVVPPQANLHDAADRCVSNTARRFDPAAAVLSLNAGFGGLNAVLEVVQ